MMKFIDAIHMFLASYWLHDVPVSSNEIFCIFAVDLYLTFAFPLLVVVNVDKTSEVNYQLIDSPDFTYGYLQTDHKVW